MSFARKSFIVLHLCTGATRGADMSRVRAIAFTAGPKSGAFRFEIDREVIR
jgi:hypothetical protein